MVIEDNKKMPDFSALKDIPDAWAERGTCPACGAKPLKVVHFSDIPDYFLCSKCEMSFEVETNFKAIRVKNIPEKLEFVEEKLRYHWVELSTLRHYLNNRQALIQEKAGLAAPATSLSDDEVWSRMLSLYRLGNKPKMIQFILIQAGATQEQADAAFIRLKRWSEQETRGLNRKFWLVGGVTFFLIFVMMAGTVFTVNRMKAQLEEKASNPSATNPSMLPMDALKLLPDVIKPEFLKSPAATVEQTGPASARCPVRPDDAAKLFGGRADSWQPGNQPDSWQMMDATGAPNTIRVPAKMYAGYIDNKTFVFSSADGPATIHNVNFVAIMCQ
jgi:hypothetical protein